MTNNIYIQDLRASVQKVEEYDLALLNDHFNKDFSDLLTEIEACVDEYINTLEDNKDLINESTNLEEEVQALEDEIRSLYKEQG